MTQIILTSGTKLTIGKDYIFQLTDNSVRMGTLTGIKGSLLSLDIQLDNEEFIWQNRIAKIIETNKTRE